MIPMSNEQLFKILPDNLKQNGEFLQDFHGAL